MVEAGRTLLCLVGPLLLERQSCIPWQVVESRGPLPVNHPWELDFRLAVFIVSLTNVSMSCQTIDITYCPISILKILRIFTNSPTE